MISILCDSLYRREVRRTTIGFEKRTNNISIHYIGARSQSIASCVYVSKGNHVEEVLVFGFYSVHTYLPPKSCVLLPHRDYFHN